jgi:hypothetical protein
VLPAPATPIPANESPDPDSESYDILDEVLALFRANTFFRNFEIQGPADRLLIYGILYVSEILSKIRPNHGVRDATKEVLNTALDNNFAIPGDPGFPLNQVGYAFDLKTEVCYSVTDSLLPRCTSPLVTDKMPSSCDSTWPRCARNWRRDY